LAGISEIEDSGPEPVFLQALEQALRPPESGGPGTHDHEQWVAVDRTQIVVGEPDGTVDGEAGIDLRRRGRRRAGRHRLAD
jgi:hypothetical protein